MDQLLAQLPLSLRIPTLKSAIETCRAHIEQAKQEEAVYLDLLAQAEAAVTGKAPGWEGVALSGLIPEGSNPHDPHAVPPADAVGDTADQSGKSAGDPTHAGSEPSPKSPPRHTRR